MKVKSKLRLGFGFLFIVVLFFGAVSMFYINQISNNAKVILKDNYESLSYCRQMQTILDENSLPLNAAAIAAFNTQLNKEAHNITEPGEKESVDGLKRAVNFLIAKPATSVDVTMAEKQIRRYLRDIEKINMQAIVRKNDIANTSVAESTLFLGLTGAFTFLILFSFSVNFPGLL
jgi:NtrC-family two-component system sensor histidine kinase KinB